MEYRSSSQPRRILVISPQPFYEDRGTPIAVAQVVSALHALGYEVDLLAYPIGEELTMPGVRVLRCANPLGFRRVRIGFSLRKVLLDLCMLVAIKRLLLRERYAAVHVLEELAFAAVPMCRRRSLPVVYDMQSSLPDQLRSHWAFRSRFAQLILRDMERHVLQAADAVVCSAGLLDHVRRAAPAAAVTEWRFVGQRKAPDPWAAQRLRSRLGIDEQAPVVLYAGTFEPYQGLDLLIGAIPIVLDLVPEAVCVLIGATGADELRRHAIVRNLVERGKLHVLPRQPRASIPDYYAMADVLVSPRAYGDNIPLKIFDYMLSGKPIVATDLRAHRSILDARTAVLVDKTALAIGEAIVRCLREPHFAARIAQAALEQTGRTVGGQSFVELVRSVYGELGSRSKDVKLRDAARRPA